MASEFRETCYECDEVFHSKFDFMEHENIHSKETPFMCISCKKSFGLVKEYVAHIISKHKVRKDLWNKNGEITCRKCLKNCKNYQDLKSHKCTRITGIGKSAAKCNCCSCCFYQKKIKYSDPVTEVVKPFSCSDCGKHFSSSLILSRHKCYPASPEEIIKCGCSVTFTDTSAFKTHVGKKPYSCCSCSMKFNTITNLKRHVITHTKQKPYVCKVCGRGFSQSANLRNHSSIHLGIGAVKCDECNFSCKTHNGLIKHKKKHSEGVYHHIYMDGRKHSTKKSTCPICNKQFLFKRNMGMHMKVHNNITSLCNDCGKVFDSKSKLTSHYKACHRQPSLCLLCGKVFASAVLLGAHKRIHVSDKVFTCDFCQKTFSVKNYLVQHIKTHSNKKQFSCSKCGKLFKVAVSLKYHSNICTSLNFPI